MKSEIKDKIFGKTHYSHWLRGNINKIFSMSKTKDGKPMSANLLKTYYKEAAPLSVQERMIKYNVREDRADVMVPALEIFNKIMLWGEIKQIYVPKISVADGLIHSLYNKIKSADNISASFKKYQYCWGY